MAARKAGSIVPKGRNKHLIRWFIGRGPDGKRRYASKTIDGTFSQAQKALGKETHDVSQGSYVGPAKQTLGQYMTAWLDEVAATEVRQATLKSYKVRVEVDVRYCSDRRTKARQSYAAGHSSALYRPEQARPQSSNCAVYAHGPQLCAQDRRGMEAHQRQPLPTCRPAEGHAYGNGGMGS